MKLVLGVCLSLQLATPLFAWQDAFPTAKSVTIKEDDKRWVVNERATIANSISIVSLRAGTIDGVSKENENVILVSGTLELKAVKGGRVVLNNVWIELQPDAKSLYLSDCQFNGGGVRTTADQVALAPKIFMESTTFGVGASLTLSLKAGSVDVQGTHLSTPVIVKGFVQSEKSPNKSSVAFLSCSMLGGLEVSSIADVLVRNTELAGAMTRMADCAKLDFGGNNVKTTKCLFTQRDYGSFGTTKVHSCDFRKNGIEFRTPAPEKKLESLTLDHCWFSGLTKPEEISAKMVLDNATDPTTGVTIIYSRISATPLGLASGGRGG